MEVGLYAIEKLGIRIVSFEDEVMFIIKSLIFNILFYLVFKDLNVIILFIDLYFNQLSFNFLLN